MMAKYNTDEDGVREIMRQRQVKSREKYKGTGGFRALTPERRLEISRLGVQAREKGNLDTPNIT